MANVQDILIDINYDMLITNGDIAIGEATYQHVYLILSSQKGEWKQYPLLGVGIEDKLGDNDTNYWKYLIRSELRKDGLEIDRLDISDDQLIINAKYK
jgi:hypothetical protein